MPHTRLLPPLAALATCAALTGCGGSSSSPSGVSANAYVKSICNSVAPFERDVINRSSALNLTAVKSPAQGKTALKGFLTAISTDTDTAVAKLSAAGTPSVKDGAHISGAILTAFRQLQTALHRATAQANGLSTTSATAFRSGAVALGNDVRNSMSAIGQNLQSSTLQSPALQKAARTEPACTSIGS